VTHARNAIEGNRNFAFPIAVLALGCARLGQREEAVQAIRQLVSAAPGFRIGPYAGSGSPTRARCSRISICWRTARLPD